MLLNQTTLGELYQSLNQEEMKGLELYLQKNTVGKQNILFLLHKLMAQAKLEAMLAKLDTDYIKAELFGGDEKSISKLTTYNNLLINHIKDYLILSKVKEKNIYTETLWGEILIERALKRNLLLKLTTFRYDLYKDGYPLFKKFLNEREKFFYQYITLTKRNYEDLVESQYRQIEAFDNYRKYYSLELISSLASLVKQKNKSITLKQEEVTNLLESSMISENLLVQIQALSLNLILDKHDASYYKLANILKEKFELISKELLSQLVPNLLNYGVGKVNKGIEEFDIENYKLFGLLYENSRIFIQGVFSVVRLFTYIRLELRYGTIEKAEQLLEESLKVISPAQKDSFQYLIESRISFAKKDYKVSLRKISTINPSDSIYYFPQYKIMLIKNYIMLADIDRLMAERENFYKYLNNQKNIQEDEKRRHKLFIKYTEYLTNARYEYLTDYMKKRIENALLQTSPYFSEKQWVRERWEELRILNS